jgi:hypothetical protein
VLIPPDSGLRKSARPGWDGGLYAFMRRVLSTAPAKALRSAFFARSIPGVDAVSGTWFPLWEIPL